MCNVRNAKLYKIQYFYHGKRCFPFKILIPLQNGAVEIELSQFAPSASAEDSPFPPATASAD